MFFKKTILPRLPLVLAFSVLLSVAVWTLWSSNVSASVLTYSTSAVIVSKVPASSKPKMIYDVGRSVYAMVFTSTTATGSPTTTCANAGTGGGASGNCSIYFTTSSNGISWSNPRVVTTTLAVDNNGGEAFNSFTLDSFQNPTEYSLVFEGGTTHAQYIMYSSDGVTWTTHSGINAGGQQLIDGGKAYLAFSTSSNLVATLALKGHFMVIATTSDRTTGNGWPTSTIEDVVDYYNPNDGNCPGASCNSYQVVPLGVSISGPSGSEIIHAVYARSTSTAALGTNIIYASSTNKGLTWTTSSISGVIPLAAFDGGASSGNSTVPCFECTMDATAVDPVNGRLAVAYHKVTALNADGAFISQNGVIAVTTTLMYAQIDPSTNAWTNTQVQARIPVFATDTPGGTNFNLQPTAMTLLTTGVPYISFFGTSSLPYVAVNTSTFFVQQLNTDFISSRSKMTVTYNSSLQVASVAYVSNYGIKFATSSLRLALYSSAGSISSITPAMTTDGGLYVNVSTTLSDADSDVQTVYMDYSVNAGGTWASSTIVSSTLAGSVQTTSTGRVTNVQASTSGQTLNIGWDAFTDLGATSTSNIKLRITSIDQYSASSYQTSAAFTVDTLVPTAATNLVLTPSTSTISMSWTSSTADTISFFVSSTATTNATTTASSTSFSSLTPNTQYTFQVRPADTYGNIGSFSSASSTYTNANIPSAISASANGTTSLIVTWTSDNASGTTYELYNVTTGASVGTMAATSYTVSGLTAGTSYQFKVRALYASDSVTYSSYSDTSAAVSTTAASTSSGGGGASPSASAAPSVPVIAPVVPAEVKTVELELNKPIKQVIGSTEHTVTAQAASETSATFLIQSDPLNVKLIKDVPQELDTNKDTVADLKATYRGLKNGKPVLELASLTDGNELKNPITINYGAYKTKSSKVTISLNSTGATQIALSNAADFAGSAFQSYQASVPWTLLTGNGKRTVYARLRTATGGVVTVSDSIDVVGTTEIVTPPAIVVPPTTPVIVKPVVYFTFTKQLGSSSKGTDVLELQKVLRKLGYYTVAKDSGVYDKATTDAVKKFQKAKGISQVGTVGPSTLKALNALSAPATVVVPVTTPTSVVTKSHRTLYSGMSGSDVTDLQVKLQTLGFLSKSVKPNGNFGPATVKAVKAFQKANKISQVGSVGPVTWKALDK